MTTDRPWAAVFFLAGFTEALGIAPRRWRLRWQNATRKGLALVFGADEKRRAAPRPARRNDPHCPLSARDSPEHGQRGQDVRAHEVAAPPDTSARVQDHRPQPAARGDGLLVLAGRARARRLGGI